MLVHEAGHAVLAADFGYVFESVSINLEPWNEISDLGNMTGGGVHMASPQELTRIVQADLTRSLQFCLAGALAERAHFGHCLDRSFLGDINVWRNGAGLLEGQSLDTLEAALGRPFLEVSHDTDLLIEQRAVAVKVVGRALGTSAGMSLTFAEVLGLVAAN
jgi:hypothetical protein